MELNMNKPLFVDLGDVAEDQRIEAIGHQAMVHKKVVSFITDADEGKADRYIRKLEERFPGIVVIARGNGPVANTVFVKVGPTTN
jgi:hypothetical protein